MTDRPHKVLLLSYEAESITERNLDQLYKELTESGGGWWHHLNTTWLLCVGDTPEELWERVKGFFGEDDSILIIEVTPNYFGWLTEKAWKWIDHHVAHRDHREVHAGKARRSAKKGA
jgi:hypothetical protein